MDSGGVLGRISAVLGKYAEVVGKASLERIWEVLGGSCAGPGLLLGILVGSWEAFKLSWEVLGLSWAALGGSWTLLGSSWAFLGGPWALLEVSWALLGCSGSFLGAKLELRWSAKGAASTPRSPHIEAKTVQDSFDM